MGDADDERGVDERMLAFTEGLVALQAAVTQVTNTVGAFVMLTQGGAIITLLVAPLVCDDMRANMAVTSAYKLSKLGVGHFHSPTDSEEQSLIVAVEPKKFEHVPLHVGVLAFPVGVFALPLP